MLLQENPAFIYPVQYGGVYAQLKPKVRTKKAWINYFKRHRDMCIYVVPSSAPCCCGDEIPVNPKQWVEMLIEDKSLIPCKSKKGGRSMSQEILFKDKKITLSPKALKNYSTTLLKEARARCNKEVKYLSQFDSGLDKLCANVWKTASDKISKELKRRVPANV